MKAFVQTAYGSSDVLKLVEVEEPQINENEVLIKNYATSVNAGDFFTMTGKPWLVRLIIGLIKPKNHILGWDVAGKVEKVGSNVKRIKKGDEVYGAVENTFAEYVKANENKIAIKPKKLSFEQAGAIPTATLTALQGIRDHAKVKKNMKVLINGASGGVGSFAVQIAKFYGAEVTGVCSGKNKDLVLSIGADNVIDYENEDFTKKKKKYDIIFDNVANRSFSDLRSITKSNGKIIPNSGHGGMTYVIKAFLLSAIYKKNGKMFMAKPNYKDMDFLSDLLSSEKIKPFIDKIYPFDETTKAMDYIGTHHASGKVIISFKHHIK